MFSWYKRKYEIGWKFSEYIFHKPYGINIVNHNF